jgi:hypothetical protein
LGLKPIARLGDKINHSNAQIGQLIGAGFGFAVGAGIVIGVAAVTGGVGLAFAIPMIAGCTTAVASFGKFVGGFSESETGEVKEGAARTFIGPNIRKVARWSDGVECQDSIGANMSWTTAAALSFVTGGLPLAAKAFSAHNGAFVNDAIWFVFVESKPIGFFGAKTSCDGDIAKPIDGEEETKRTLVDGPVVGILSRKELKSDNPVMEWSLWALDWAGTIASGGSLKPTKEILLPSAIKAGGAILEKTLGPSNPVTFTYGLLAAAFGVKDAINWRSLQGLKKLEIGVGGVAIPLDQAGKVKELMNGPPQELAPVAASEAARDAERAGLGTDYGPLGTAPGMPWWVSWSGRAAK